MEKFAGLIPADLAVGVLWPSICALLEQAMPYGRGEYTLDDIRAGIEKREMMAIGVFDEHAQAEFVATCSVVNYPRKRVLYIQYGAGKDGAQLRTVVSDVAKSLGCDWIETRCRYAVAKLYRRNGFDIGYCVPILEIEHEAF